MIGKPEPDNEELRVAVDNLLKAAISSGQFLGLGFVAVGRHGEVLYNGAHGHRDFARTEPMTITTSGWMASMTKLMTSVAAMQVVEKGLVASLDQDLGEILPQLGDREILTSFAEDTKAETFTKPTSKITMRTLLSHSSGFAYDPLDQNLIKWATANGRDKEMLSGEQKAYERPLVFNPGSGWRYGPGIDWAGKVIEAVSHKSLDEYMQEHIWSRVGMSNTTFHPEHRPSFPMLDLGMRLSGPNEPLTPGQSPFPVPALCEMGGAGIYSNAWDYAQMLAALLADESPLLKPESVEEFLKPQLSDSSRAELGQMRALDLVQVDIPRDVRVDHSLGGLLVLDDIPGRRNKGSVCWDGMTNSNWVLDRERGFACVLFVQILPCPDIATKELWTNLETQVFRHVGKTAADQE
ncbi:hypothetical protein PV08_11434 [Exophiala spinifera]|uniref:Beta-lactamase-related domain-containing protein n=1 Tax=Exophiala spinifera TaxID=91928 RepID=A0A0D2AVL8_9EURO|nr:uncharacterized protein PV08_11434 [Exophiala spinifera]KIW10470.1 hypothetical protein PV08_11434 [Exophiala spinifera]